MTNKYLKKFNEPSRTISLRVPTSQHEFYKERFKSIVNQDFKGYETNLMTEILVAFNSYVDFINGIHSVLEAKGSINTSDYHKLYTILNIGAIQSVSKILKNNGS